jgi:hypothetical protein
VTNANDSFIDEVSEAVRRDRLALWFRRWGWAILLAVALVVGAAAWIEWREAQGRAAAELRGEAILTSLELPGGEGRLAALSELPREGAEGAVSALLLAAEQEGAGDAPAAAATLAAVAADEAVPDLWRDLAALKAQIALGDAADPAALEGLAAPGEPFRLLALEQLAALHLASGRDAEAAARLRELREDAEATPAQAQRADALLTALGEGPTPAAPPAAAASASPEAATAAPPDASPAPILDAGPALEPGAQPRPPAAPPEAPAEAAAP